MECLHVYGFLLTFPLFLLQFFSYSSLTLPSPQPHLLGRAPLCRENCLRAVGLNTWRRDHGNWGGVVTNRWRGGGWVGR